MYSLSVRKVVQLALLVDNPHRSFLSADPDALNVIRCLAQGFELVVENVCTLHRCLSMELSRVGDLEKNVLHDV